MGKTIKTTISTITIKGSSRLHALPWARTIESQWHCGHGYSDHSVIADFSAFDTLLRPDSSRAESVGVWRSASIHMC